MRRDDDLGDTPPLRRPMESYRLEVRRRASRLRHRRLAVVSGLTAVVLISSSLVTWQVTSQRPTDQKRSAAQSTHPSPRHGPVVPTTAPSSSPQGAAACYPDSACVSDYTLVQFPNLSRTTHIGSDGALIFDLVRTDAVQWGLPTVTTGRQILSLFMRRSERSGTEELSVFKPVVTSGTATVTLSCVGTGCPRSVYSFRVQITPMTPLATTPPTPPCGDSRGLSPCA